MSARKTKNAEWVNGLLLLAFAVWIWLYSANFPSLDEGYPGPALFPRIVAAGFAVCGLLLLYPFKGMPFIGNYAVPVGRIVILLGGLMMVLLFPFLINLIGFVPSLGVLCLCFGLLLQVSWWKAAVTAALTAGVIYFLFVIGLGVSL